jgi:predicted amidohydrolase YtcJ
VDDTDIKADLARSPALRDLPIVLYRIDVHAAWVSPAVLELMGELPLDGEGGKVVRDADGAPTGVFIDNAMRWHIDRVSPPITDELRLDALNTMTSDVLALGMTGLHDAGQHPVDLAFFRRMAEEGALGMRFYTMLLCVDRARFCGDTVERITGAQDGRFTLQSIKLMADGALGSRGAALLEEYSDSPSWRGFLLTDEAEWAPLIKRYYDDGWQVVCVEGRRPFQAVSGIPSSDMITDSLLTTRMSTVSATAPTTSLLMASKQRSAPTPRPAASAGSA